MNNNDFIASGFSHLDKLLGGGLRKGEATILAARPAQGKTALSLRIASHAALKTGEAVLFFSAELSKHQVMERLISWEADVDLSEIRSGFFRRDKWTALTETAARFSEAPLYIMDRTQSSVSDFFSAAELLHNALGGEGKKLGLFVIDQLHLLIGSSDVRAPDRWGGIEEILKRLMALAVERDAAVLILVQLPFRPKGRLQRAGVADHFDRAIMLYRLAAYDPDPAVTRIAMGLFGECVLQFDPATSRFFN